VTRAPPRIPNVSTGWLDAVSKGGRVSVVFRSGGEAGGSDATSFLPGPSFTELLPVRRRFRPE